MLRVLSPLIVSHYDLKSLSLILLVFSWSTLVDSAPDAHMVLERNFFVGYISDAVLESLISLVSGLQKLINRFASLQKLSTTFISTIFNGWAAQVKRLISHF